jgi:L-aminopeptidase/D-esterase-like protein
MGKYNYKDKKMYKGSLTDVKGIQVGCAQDNVAQTGCTVVLCPPNTVAGVDVRGSAPGTRETDLLGSEKMMNEVHAIALCGGSAYGLDAATGVMAYLEEKGIGFHTGDAIVPIVPAAVLYDLGVGSPNRRPDAQMGYDACANAMKTIDLNGNIGAGTGATACKIAGMDKAVKTGLGTSSIQLQSGLVVAAVVALNAVGDVFDIETGKQLIGPYDRKNKKMYQTTQLMQEIAMAPLKGKNTTIGVVACNAKLTKPYANKVAQMAQNGLARVIVPTHTMYDGDTIFALATGEVESDVSLVGTLAAQVVAQAIINAVKCAESTEQIISYSELEG